MSFEINDVAVYPGKGVGRITDITEKDVDGKMYTVYVMKFPAEAEAASDITSILEVPLTSSTTRKIRKIMPAESLDEVFTILRHNVTPNTQTWNRRYREYLMKIATGDPLEVAHVLRDLALLKARKNLSFGERKTYDQALSLIIEEAAHSLYAENQKQAEQLQSLQHFKNDVTESIAAVFRPIEEAARAEQEEKASGKKSGKKKAAKVAEVDSTDTE